MCARPDPVRAGRAEASARRQDAGRGADTGQLRNPRTDRPRLRRSDPRRAGRHHHQGRVAGAGRSLSVRRGARRRSAPLPARRRRAGAPRFGVAARRPLAGPSSAGGGDRAARPGDRSPGRRRGAAVSPGERAEGAGAPRTRHRAAGDGRQRTGRSPAGQPARAARRARHGGRRVRPRLRVRPADHRAHPVGRRLARRHHRLRHGAGRCADDRRRRGAARRHRAGLGDARPQGGPHAPRTRQRRGTDARRGRWRRHRPA